MLDANLHKGDFYMSLGKLINKYGEVYTPYVGELVNHLPMGQVALFKLENDLNKVEKFTKAYIERYRIDRVGGPYEKIDTDNLEDYLGKRYLYEDCLNFIKKLSVDRDIEDLTEYILNKYAFGMSSGLFHTLIRLAYAIEAYKIDKLAEEEVKRALAYYVTAYKKGEVFNRQIDEKDFIGELKKLKNDEYLIRLIEGQDSFGKKLKGLYEDKFFIENAFTLKGDVDDKIEGLLNFLVPNYYYSKSFIVLHCITGLHALITLKEYIDDFNMFLDIFTSFVVTHVLVIDYRDYRLRVKNKAGLTWRYILSMAVEEKDIHSIKLAYTSYELYKKYPKECLKDIALGRLNLP